MSTIAERFKEIRKEKRITQAEYAEVLGISRQVVANTEAGNNNPAIDTINKLITEFNVNANWLIAGIGEPFLETPEDDDRITAIVDEILKKHGLIK